MNKHHLTAIRRLFVGVAAAATVSGAAPADDGPSGPSEALIGTWAGEARVNGSATPFEVEFSTCPRGVCGAFSLPALGYRRMPMGPVRPGDGDAFAAKPLSGRLNGGVLSGELAGHGGGGLIDALPHGAKATVSLRRGPLTPLGVELDPITFDSGGVRLAGSFVRPRGKGPFPVVVFVHGSGPSTRWPAMGQARALADLGYASLIFDKRGGGDSGGDWTRASLDDLARDAVAAARYAAGRPDVDPERIGLWGHSQGGWVIPRAVRLGAPASFAVVLAGGGATPREVEDYGYQGTLTHLGVDFAARSRALALVDRYLVYLAGSISLAEMTAALDADRTQPWFNGLGLERVLPDEAYRSQWAWVANYDPAADIGGLDLPLLLVFGGDDHATPSTRAISRWKAALAPARAVRTEIVLLPAADHHLRRKGEGWSEVAAEFPRIVADWLSRL